jgi:hypothetical protein
MEVARPDFALEIGVLRERLSGTDLRTLSGKLDPKWVDSGGIMPLTTGEFELLKSDVSSSKSIFRGGLIN